MITVVNKYKVDLDDLDGYVVNIMRGHSVLANKYKIFTDGNREEVIRKYKLWLRRQYLKGNKVYREINRLTEIAKTKDLYLVCCCKPLQCHGDVVANWINILLASEFDQEVYYENLDIN